MDEIAKIGKAVASVCKGDDNKSDDIMMMVLDSNWDQFLTPAPCAIALLGDLILISANTDFNLDEKAHRDGFKKPRYPNSFQESLVQVSNAGFSAFNEAHTSMDQIRLHSENVDVQVKNAVKLLMQGTPEEVKRMLPMAMSKIQNFVDESLLLAKASEDRFVGVIELGGELLEASINTKGVYDEKTKEKEIAIEVARTKFRMKEIKKAQSEFKEAINILPSGGDLIGIAVCEALMGGVRNITSFQSKMSEGIKKKQSSSTSAVTAAIENARYKISFPSKISEGIKKKLGTSAGNDEVGERDDAYFDNELSRQRAYSQVGGDLIGTTVCEALMGGVRNITSFQSKMSEGIKKKQSSSTSAVTAAIENARYKISFPSKISEGIKKKLGTSAGNDEVGERDDAYFDNELSRQRVYSQVSAITRYIYQLMEITTGKTDDNGQQCPDMGRINHGDLGRIQQFIETARNHVNSEVNSGDLRERVLKLCDNAIDICNTLQRLAKSMADLENRNTVVSEAVNKCKCLQNESHKLEVEAHNALGRNPLDNKSHHLSKMPTQSGSSSAVTAATENARYKTELAKETLRDAKRRQEKSADELRESNEKLTKVLMDMAKLDLEQIDFDTIRETLIKGIKALAEVREQWGKLVHFFQMLSNRIRGCLHSSLTDFVEQAIIGREIQMTNDDAPLSDKLRDVIFEKAPKANQVAYKVRTITGTYVQISNEHLMDRITCLGLLVALDPKKDKLEIRRKHEELHNGCQEAQKTILPIVMNAGNMSVVQARIHEKYKYNFEKVLEYLLKGLEHLSAFIQHLNDITGGRCKDDDKYIAKVLFPLIEKAKKEFDEMSTYAEGLLQQINSDFERCVADLKVNNDKLKEIDSNLNELEKELQGTKKSVDNANDQCRRKREDLTAAENTLSDARRKLEDAKTTQATTSTAGVATTVVSAFLTFLIPPLGLAGMAAGVGTGIVSGTALEEAVSLCSNNCSSACSEVQSSESALERAKNAKTEVENKLDRANKKKQQTKTQMEDVKSDKNRLEEYRNLIIIFGEDYKKFNRQLCDFYGKYKILRCETSGGYSLCMLQSPTKMLGTSLSSLCKCVAIQTLCEQPMQAIMRKHLLQIECVKWQTDDECSDIDHLI